MRRTALHRSRVLLTAFPKRFISEFFFSFPPFDNGPSQIFVPPTIHVSLFCPLVITPSRMDSPSREEAFGQGVSRRGWSFPSSLLFSKLPRINSFFFPSSQTVPSQGVCFPPFSPLPPFTLPPLKKMTRVHFFPTAGRNTRRWPVCVSLNVLFFFPLLSPMRGIYAFAWDPLPRRLRIAPFFSIVFFFPTFPPFSSFHGKLPWK